MRLIESIWTKARSKVRTIVLPEGDEPRTVAAAEILRKEGLADSDWQDFFVGEEV